MKEIEILSGFFSFYHFSGKLVILCKELWQIFFPECVLLRIFCNYRLHRNLFEAQISQMKNIICKIQIVMRKCTADIILVLITALCKLLEFRHDQIIASFSVAEWSHMIVDFFSSINTEYNIPHLFVCKFHYFIIQ